MKKSSENSYLKLILISVVISTISYLIGASGLFFNGSNVTSLFAYLFIAFAVVPVSPGMVVNLVASINGIHVGQMVTIFVVNLAYHSILYAVLKKTKIKVTLPQTLGIGFSLALIIIVFIYLNGARGDHGALLTYLFPILLVIIVYILRKIMKK